MFTALPWLLFLATLLITAWGYFAFVQPAWDLQEVLRRLSQGEWNAPGHVSRRGRLGAAADDLISLAERLRENHRKLGDEVFNLQALLGSLSEGVLIVDASQRINLANHSLYRMFDLRMPWRDRTLMEVFRDHTLQEIILAALDQGTPQTRQITLEVRQDQRYVQKHFAITAASLRPPDSNTTKGVIAIFHDITELKALEAVRRDFVANVSHELRTPLAIINGYLETLLDGAMDDRETAQKFLRVMWKHNERLNLLIEDLLSLSQLETRQAAGLNFESVQLRTCVERVIERLEPNISEKGASVRLTFSEAVPTIEADAHRMDQVFSNLIENALKYGDNARPEIRISAELADGRASICVADNGPGIPQVDQPHIFERFYRVHKDRSRAVGGTGLGLSIVKHVVQAHGGQVAVSSQPGRGASFHLSLPVSQRN